MSISQGSVDVVTRALALADLDEETRDVVDLDAHLLHVRAHYEELARAAITAYHAALSADNKCNERDELSTDQFKLVTDLADMKARALKAEQERDEAYERAAKVAESVGQPVGASDGCGTYIPGTSADAARAIRRLAGPEKEGK